MAAPFIKLGEAQWLCDQVRTGVEITTLAKIDSQAVGMSALDIAALRCLRQSSPAAELIALPNLHAKVFVADEQAAIVTSGNLTRSGIDRNIEYGVLFREPCLAGKVRSDMLRFAAMGSRVGPDALAEMEPLEAELRRAWDEATGRCVVVRQGSLQRRVAARQARVRLRPGGRPQRPRRVRRRDPVRPCGRPSCDQGNPVASPGAPARPVRRHRVLLDQGRAVRQGVEAPPASRPTALEAAGKAYLRRLEAQVGVQFVMCVWRGRAAISCDLPCLL